MGATTYELEEVLHPQVITEQHREISSEFFTSPLTDFYQSQMRDISGDRFQFAYRAAVKDPAPGNTRGAPARVLQPTGLHENIVYMLRAFNSLTLGADALHMIRKPESTELQTKGREEIMRQMEDFGDRHKVFRALCLAKTLSDGVIYFRSDGEILESSSGSQYSVDFAVPASHKSQLDSPSSSFSSDIIATAWDQAGALILDDLDDIRIAAKEINAPQPNHIWLHDTAKRWLRGNTQLVAYITGGGSPEKVDRVLSGSMIEDLNGWTWHFDSSTYTAVDGTTKPFIPTTKAIITPDVGPWLRARNGSELITRYVGLNATVDEAINQMEEVFGEFAYVKLEDNPARLTLFMGDNFVHAFANPNAVWMPTIDF